MKKWRPDGWKNTYLYFGSPHTLNDYESNNKRVAFEAGADAMLEALKKNGEYKEHWFLNGVGWSVFIPDEESDVTED